MVSLYVRLVGASLRSRMQYKLNFLFSSVTYGVLMAIDFVILVAILYRFDNVRGWDIYEVGVLYGTASAAMAIYRLLAPEIHNFDRYIVQGEFDSLLIRPVSPLFLLLTRNIDLGRVGGVVQGLAVLGYSWYGLAEAGRLSSALLWYAPVMLFSGALICFAIGLTTATLSFWTGQIKEFQVFTLYAPFNAANYPISIYPMWLKVIFFTILPVAFVNYYPVMFLLDKGGSWSNLLVTPVVALVVVFVAYRFWSFGIRHYHSTGN